MRTLKILLILFCPFFIKGQNLIPNYSFEDTTRRVTPLFLPANWYTATSEGVNYFTPLQNSTNPYWGAPQSILGYQQARTGSSYIGMLVYHLYTNRRNSKREYFQVQLKRALVQDSTYCLQLFMSLADSSHFASRNQFGVYFSNQSFFVNTDQYLPYTPQIIVSPLNYINDKVNWMEFNFSYKALGGEEYITLGNFNDTTHLDTIAVGGGDPSVISYLNTYYYIDDVWLSHCDSLPDSSIGIKENSLASSISVFPNPFQEFFTVEINNSIALSFRLFNLLGKDITNQIHLSNKGSAYHIQLSNIPRGIYFLQVSDGKERASFKLIKE